MHREIQSYLVARTEALVARFLPGFRIPGFMAGYPAAAHDTADLIYLLIGLHDLGVETVAGAPVTETVKQLLRGVDGATTETFYSYRVAEGIKSVGGFEALTGFTEAEKANLREAIDSTHIFEPEKKVLRGQPANYWAVLARCEWARQKVGALEDTAILDFAVMKTKELLALNPLGYFDDSLEGDGRYDIYSADVLLFTEPFWHLLEEEVVTRSLREHLRLLEVIALRNGAFVAWGRSVGALSVVLTLELGAIALRKNLAADPARMMGLMRNAFLHFQTWMEDDLISAHRGRMTEQYRGLQRLLQMTMDCLSKLCLVAGHLREAAPVAAFSGELFPDRDELISFDAQGAGLWMYRDAQIEFQLPLVGGMNADYVAWLHGPGVFENPVDCQMICGVPRVALDGVSWFPGGRPSSTLKFPGGIELEFRDFRTAAKEVKGRQLTGSRHVRLAVRDGVITGDERWTFEPLPGAIGFHVPESRQPFALEISSPNEHWCSVAVVEGMSEWRSCWGELRRLHQVDFAPATGVRLTWKLRLK